jgi:hypothetical protein
MAETKHTLPGGKEIRIYDHGGVDVLTRDGWASVATTPDECLALARLALEAAERGLARERAENG